MQGNQILKKGIAIILILILPFISLAVVKATTTTTIEPADNQYLELKATTITDVEGQNKQVIMELWGYDIDFKRIRC